MGSWSIGHWIIVLVIVLLLFGANKIPKLMGDMAKGVKEFKKGLKEEDEASAAQPQTRSIEGEAKPVETKDAAPKA